MDKTVCKMQWIKNALYLNVSDASVSSINPISTVLFYFDQFYLRPIKMSYLNMSYGEMSDFVWFSLFVFSLVTKLRSLDLKIHWNTLIFFDKKRYGVIFENVPWNNAWFCFISIVWVHFEHKTEKFWFRSHWNALIFFDKKDMVIWCQIWICPMEKCLILFHFHCFGSL